MVVRLMLVYHVYNKQGESAVTSQLLEFPSVADAEALIKATSIENQSLVATSTLKFIRLYRVKS